MNVAIMQPYFFPYIGYFQLMHAVDTFVVYDDVHFIKRGWIHRNQILMDGAPHPIVLPVQKASQNRLISDHVRAMPDETVVKQIAMLRQAYRKAPYYHLVMPVIERSLRYPNTNVALYLMYGLRQVAEYIGLRTRLILSSDLVSTGGASGQARIIERCRQLGATHYVNAINGIHLYDTDTFERNGIELSFLKTENPHYEQGDGSFHPNLSIIDVMMYNSPTEIRALLERYTLLSAHHITEEA